MQVSINLNDKEEAIVTNFAKSNNLSISEVIKQAILHQIEFLEDLKIEEKLDKADLEAETTSLRYNSDEVFGKLRQSLNV